ncbi:MAG: hypothetical protein MJB14_02285, partial [Spirochaetes bacterium]|nr:hypothetical protein [Spirochaetota bacterium]
MKDKQINIFISNFKDYFRTFKFVPFLFIYIFIFSISFAISFIVSVRLAYIAEPIKIELQFTDDETRTKWKGVSVYNKSLSFGNVQIDSIDGIFRYSLYSKGILLFIPNENLDKISMVKVSIGKKEYKYNSTTFLSQWKKYFPQETEKIKLTHDYYYQLPKEITFSSSRLSVFQNIINWPGDFSALFKSINFLVFMISLLLSILIYERKRVVSRVFKAFMLVDDLQKQEKIKTKEQESQFEQKFPGLNKIPVINWIIKFIYCESKYIITGLLLIVIYVFLFTYPNMDQLYLQDEYHIYNMAKTYAETGELEIAWDFFNDEPGYHYKDDLGFKLITIYLGIFFKIFGESSITAHYSFFLLSIIFIFLFYSVLKKHFMKDIAFFSTLFLCMIPFLIYYSIMIRAYIWLLVFYTIMLDNIFNIFSNFRIKSILINSVIFFVLLYLAYELREFSIFYIFPYIIVIGYNSYKK